jgi:glycine betaine/choline ABC-type transport system substrate-binding protein
VQVASGFATDPQLDRPSVVELADDRDYFLPYQPMPAVHAPTAEAYPEILETLAPIAAALDGSTIRRLNRRVLVEDHQPGTVARSYLEQLGEAT